MDTKLILDEINKNNYKKIFENFEYDDPEVIDLFRENEEIILDRIFLFPTNISIEEKRNRYVRELLDNNAHLTKVTDEKYKKIYDEIENIRKNLNASILEFENKKGGSAHRVFFFGDKVIKFGKYFKIPNDENVLQPEFVLMLENEDNFRMTVFEKVIPFELGNAEVSQVMYNRLRQKGILWMDVHSDNIGLTTHLRDEEDDGLRVIDSECMEKVYDIMEMLRVEKNEYNKYGSLNDDDAFLNYIMIKGSIGRENTYRQARLNNTLITKYEIKSVAEETNISRLQRIKDFFAGLFMERDDER